MAFKCFNNLGFFMAVRHICSWQHQLLQEEDGHWRGYLWRLLSIWARNCSCLTVWLDLQDLQKNDWWTTCLKKVRQFFEVPASWNRWFQRQFSHFLLYPAKCLVESFIKQVPWRIFSPLVKFSSHFFCWYCMSSLAVQARAVSCPNG